MKRKNVIVVLLLCAMLSLSACGQKQQIVNLDDVRSDHIVLEDSHETKQKFKKEKKASDNLLWLFIIGLGIGISSL